MLTRLKQQLLGQTVRIECHHTTTVAYINHQGGVHSRAQNQDTIHLYSLVVPLGISLQVVHWPGMDNVLVEYLSWTRPDPTEWSLDKVTMRILFHMWGTPHIDAFASQKNSHLPVWFSRILHPEAAACDALIQPSTGLFLYAFPRFADLQKVLMKIRGDRSEAVILIAPLGRGGLGTTCFYSWHVRSLSSCQSRWTSCRSALRTRARCSIRT